jgi:tetratricopeptide (TPR) repeat protein
LVDENTKYREWTYRSSICIFNKIIRMRFAFCLPVLFLFPVMLASAQTFDELNNQAFQERDNKNYYRAIELCNQSLGIKTNARSYIIRATCYYYLANYDKAIADFSNALTYHYDYYGSETKEKASIYYFMALSKRSLGRYSEAISDFNSALSYNYSASGDAYWDRGICYYNQAKYTEADEDFRQAISRISDYKNLSDLYVYRGLCQYQLRKYESSNAHFTTAISYNSSNYLAYWNRGINHYWDVKYEEALADYSKAIELLEMTGTASASSDHLAKIYKSKSYVYSALRRYNEALAAIEKSIAYNPNITDSYLTKASIYISLKKTAAARSEYENAITLEADPKKKADIYQTRSTMYRNILDYKNSLADLMKAIELNPAEGMNFWYRSIVYGYKKNYLLAIKDCNTAMELYFHDSSYTASLIWLRAEHKTAAGDVNGAKEDYQLYLKYKPASYNAYYELGRLFRYHLKNNDLANANLGKAADMAWVKKDTILYCYARIVKGETFEPLMTMSTLTERSQNKSYSYKWNLHHMACMNALAGNVTTAFNFLDKSLAAGYDDYKHLVNDRDLVALMKLPQWKVILAKYKVPSVIN